MGWRGGETLGEKCVRRKTHFAGSLREALLPPSRFMREISLLYFSLVMTLADIVVKPLFNMPLLPVSLFPPFISDIIHTALAGL